MVAGSGSCEDERAEVVSDVADSSKAGADGEGLLMSAEDISSPESCSSQRSCACPNRSHSAREKRGEGGGGQLDVLPLRSSFHHHRLD